MSTLHFTKAGAGAHLLFGTDVVTVKATSRDTSGRMLVLKVTVPPSGGPPVLHRHAYTETFYFLSGTFQVSTAGDDYRLRTLQAQAGDTVTIPSRVRHNYRNTGPAPGRFLVAHSPADIEPLLQELGQPIADPLHPPLPAGPPFEAQMQHLPERLGQYREFLPPDQIAG